jgi:hypothetical protein
LPAVGFGATIPALLRVHRDVAWESGRLLFVSSMGNVAGFVLLAFVLHPLFEYGTLLVLVAALALLALGLHGGVRRAVSWAGLAVFALALGAARGGWDESLLYYGHTAFHSSRALAQAQATRFSAESFKGGRDVFAIIRRNGEPYFFINGYISIPLSTASEKIVGALSAMFAPALDDALVLGVGSGATAGTVGLLFERTEAVEINAVVLSNLHRMTAYNFDIEHLPRLRLIHDDGIHHVRTTRQRYSLVLNTVTTPLYFSSSKLYTRDFLEDVAQRLKPGGVYTTWIDRKIGDHGMDIILQTLDSVFDECWFTYLKSSYYMLVCSDEPLAPRQYAAVTADPTLRDYLVEQFALPVELVPYSVLATDAMRLHSGGPAPINTLDFPVLEHEMARLDTDTRLLGFKDLLTERLDLREVRRRLEPLLPWDPGAFAFWSDLRLSRSSTLFEALAEVVPRQFGDVTESYADTALHWADRLRTARAYYTYGHGLYRRGACGAAVVALSRASAMEPAAAGPYYYLGRCYELQGDAVRAAALLGEAASRGHDRARAELARLDGRPGPAAPPDPDEHDVEGE